jgi:hypothetical protein
MHRKFFIFLLVVFWVKKNKKKCRVDPLIVRVASFPVTRCAILCSEVIFKKKKIKFSFDFITSSDCCHLKLKKKKIFFLIWDWLVFIISCYVSSNGQRSRKRKSCNFTFELYTHTQKKQKTFRIEWRVSLRQ